LNGGRVVARVIDWFNNRRKLVIVDAMRMVHSYI
jgi:Ni,Fe-hydrogenase maturation factor